MSKRASKKAAPAKRDPGRPVLHPNRKITTTTRISESADAKVRRISRELSEKHGFTVSIGDAIEECILNY